MTILPPDMARLTAMTLPVNIVPVTRGLVRCHRTNSKPLVFGPAPGDPPSFRFHPAAHQFGVCYFADTAFGAFAETFLRDVPVCSISMVELRARSFTEVAVRRPLRLVDLHGPGLAQLGTTAGLATVLPCDVTWLWSLALWQHADAVDGLQYRCRHDSDEMATALFDRAQGAVKVEDTTPALANPARLAAILQRYRMSLL